MSASGVISAAWLRRTPSSAESGTPYGSWTLKRAPRQAGLEPDECYILGADQSKDVPDLAIEVVLTSGGVDKLEIYRGLGVGEVWFWQAGRLAVYLLSGDRYAQVAESHLLPGLDLGMVCSLLDRPTAMDAVLELRERLREAPTMRQLATPPNHDRER